VLELFPDSAGIDDGELTVDGVPASALADEFGTPLVVYCERTLRSSAQAYRRSAPEALVAYSVKAFPSLAVLRVVAGEGLGADVSTLGELTFALRAGIPGPMIVLHGNNKSEEELHAASENGVGLVVLDALDEIELAARAGVRRVLVRATPGIDAETHDAIKTAHHGSKFGLPPDQALEAIERAGAEGLDVAGLHVHIGSQLLDLGAERMTIDWLASFAAECRAELGWTPEIVDLGGGLGIQYVEGDPAPAVEEFVAALLRRLERAWKLHDLPEPKVVLEPGRSLVGRAGFTIYRVGSVKRASDATTYAAVDGGMADNPRPHLYGARYTALLANRADEEPARGYAIAGKHCESGDVLIERVQLPEPHRGDLLAVPATGAYTLGMASNYNALPRPAAVLVAEGRARLIRRRETLDDLLADEVPE
jgi:diaminopimelate decarboxylase